jgi:hypothetical protein
VVVLDAASFPIGWVLKLCQLDRLGEHAAQVTDHFFRVRFGSVREDE